VGVVYGTSLYLLHSTICGIAVPPRQSTRSQVEALWCVVISVMIKIMPKDKPGARSAPSRGPGGSTCSSLHVGSVIVVIDVLGLVIDQRAVIVVLVALCVALLVLLLGVGVIFLVVFAHLALAPILARRADGDHLR
jgi:hypothetical protein